MTDVRFYADYVDGEIGIEIPEEYVGTYFRDDVIVSNQIRVDITYTSITINGKAFIPTGFDKNNGFVGTYDGIENYGVGFGQSQDQLVVGTERDSYSLRRIQTIASNYVGTWTPKFSDENVKLIITDFGIEIIRNGVSEYFGSDNYRFSEFGYTVKVSWNVFNVNILYYIDRSSGTPMLSIFRTYALAASGRES